MQPCSTGHGLLTVFFVFLQIKSILGQRADFEVPPIQLNRRFAWSTELPLASAINDLAPEAIPHIGLTTHHATRVEKAILETLKHPRIEPNAIFQTCNPEIPLRYLRSLDVNFGVKGFLEPAWECGTDVRGVKLHHEDEPGYTLEDLYNAMFLQGAAIQRRVNDIALRVIHNFTTPDAVFNHTYKTMSADCVLSMACMYRQGEHWHQAVGIDSNKKDHHLIDGLRQSIRENVRVVDGKLGDPMLFRLPVYDNGSTERVVLENATTFISSWRAGTNPSCFQKIPIEENPAMTDALDLTYHSTQQAEDALTISNLAILVLPLGLNVIPISLLAEVDKKSLLFYTILSDVLTVIPLGIKGIELVVIGRQRFRSVVTRILSPAYGNTTIPQAAAGEIWGAECRVREGAESAGMALIITSVVFLFIGVAAEILARNYVQKRRLQARQRRVELTKLKIGGYVEMGSGHTSTCSSDTGFVLDCDVGARGVAARYSTALEEVSRGKKKHLFFRCLGM